MTNTGILIITIGVIIVTIIICITNFFCNHYDDWKSEKLKDARKIVTNFENNHINYSAEASIKVSEQELIKLIEELKNTL